LRAFAIIFGGNSLAQLVTLATLVVLGRLYPPESFAYLAGVMSTASICAAVLHGRYQMAIPVAKGDGEPEILFAIAAMLSISLVLPFTALVLAFTQHSSPMEKERGLFLLACALVGLGAALLDVSSYWLTYREKFSVLARTNVSRALLVSASQVALASTTSLGLVYGAIGGLWLTLLLVLSATIRPIIGKLFPFVFSDILEVAKRYRHYPFFGSPQGFLAASSWNVLPLVLLGSGALGLVGQYWVAYRVLIAPLALFNASYRQATLKKIGWSDLRVASRIVKLHTVVLAAVGLVAFVMFRQFEDFIIPTIMGSAWLQAGSIAAALIVGVWADLFKVPAICFLQSKHNQKEILFWEAAIVFVRYVGALLCIRSGDLNLAISVFALIGFLGWVVFTLKVWVYDLGREIRC